MLSVTNLHGGYGRAQVLHDVSFGLQAGEVTVLLGRNGAGKSTTLKTLIGLLAASAGHVTFDGQDITGWEPFRVARAGLGYVPEDRRIFTALTVLENLEVGRRNAHGGHAAWTEDRVFDLFPALGPMRHRLGGRMSGGEQQMLAIARTLMGNPRLLLLDEPNEGLAPVIVQQMAGAILALKRQGVTILMTEQNLGFAARVADRAVVIETGRIAWSGRMDALLADEAARTMYLAI